MLEYRDEETNEIVKMLIDKARKIKISPLKKAILLKRQRVLQERQTKKEEKRLIKAAAENLAIHEPNESGFETIDDENQDEPSD